MKHSTLRKLGLVLGASALLAACGGGTEVAPLPSLPPVIANSDVPVTATQSAQGAMAFVGTVVADENANGDGLRIDAADLATSETDEPEPDA